LPVIVMLSLARRLEFSNISDEMFEVVVADIEG
jgi:hypothetical protein